MAGGEPWRQVEALEAFAAGRLLLVDEQVPE
jgi:hypothetical protein